MNTDTEWCCKFCLKDFEGEEEAVLHEVICIYSDDTWYCSICNKKFKNEYYMLKHSLKCYTKLHTKQNQVETPEILNFLYKSLILKYHPDKTNNPNLKQIFHTITLKINDAYEKKDLSTIKELIKIF